MLLNGKLLVNEKTRKVLLTYFRIPLLNKDLSLLNVEAPKKLRGLFIMTKLKITKTKKIILSAMLLSILLILSRFLSIKSSFLVISFSFIPMMLSGIYLGPKYAAIICGLRRFNWGNFISFWSILSWIYNKCSINGTSLWNFLIQKTRRRKKKF